MKNNKVLVTGGAGFIGSHFINHFLKQTDLIVINVDALTYAANLNNLKDVEDHPRYKFIKGDITDSNFISKLFAENDFGGVIHFAAESHVDNSINDPGIFINTNINGTFNLIKAAYGQWMRAPFVPNIGKESCRFHHISTDEVYGSLGPSGYFSEQTPYAPNSPYSASKASSDMLVRSFHHTYGLNTVITNCSNNYGPHQHKEKLIPTIIRRALAGEPIPIYGDGKNIRDWLYVEDHCIAVNLVYAKGKAGETYNVGGNNEQRNIDLAHAICVYLDAHRPKPNGSYSDQITFVTDRPGHDFRYAIDASKLKTELGFSPSTTFQVGIEKTIKWYVNLFSQ